MSAGRTSSDRLAGFIGDWDPEPMVSVDTLAPEAAQRLSATLNLGDVFQASRPLPPLWQWLYFAEWPPTADLGTDGHPLSGHFLPPIPNRRRMFAGGRLTMTAPLIIGDTAQRHSNVVAVQVKSGRTGELLFVTVRHEYRQRDETRVIEEQDIVYRSEKETPTQLERLTEPLARSAAPWTAHPITHAPLLFRFSALTSNAHRIHYDEAYTIGTEGFPALVVHGPLLALYMAELMRARAGDRAVASFEFRLHKPVFVGDAIEVRGQPTGDRVELTVASGSDTVHASASARLV